VASRRSPATDALTERGLLCIATIALIPLVDRLISIVLLASGFYPRVNLSFLHLYFYRPVPTTHSYDLLALFAPHNNGTRQNRLFDIKLLSDVP
jgi:hypothetical protein